ncbi:DoxX family membrane protein [Paenibacillus sp. T1]|uniref:DoxX family membrane protein n=2 Tax=Paenibacillus glycinis TaxID=2697035 RepID=A0ABW9XYS4_9BACL|nr:DoxX family membrane protein [Paenibacillus glycinis]
MKWLRENRYAAVLLTLVRFYVGWEWLTAGWHKINGGKAFDAAGFVQGAIAKPVLDSKSHEAVYPHFVAFLKHVALPNVKLFNVIVPWGELLVGAGLLLGALTTTAVLFGLLMNFMYMFAGTVSTNPWLILLGFIIVAAGANAGKFGVDHYILPYLHERLKKHDRRVPKLHTKGRLHS